LINTAGLSLALQNIYYIIRSSTREDLNIHVLTQIKDV